MKNRKFLSLLLCLALLGTSLPAEQAAYAFNERNVVETRAVKNEQRDPATSDLQAEGTQDPETTAPAGNEQTPAATPTSPAQITGAPAATPSSPAQITGTPAAEPTEPSDSEQTPAATPASPSPITGTPAAASQTPAATPTSLASMSPAATPASSAGAGETEKPDVAPGETSPQPEIPGDQPAPPTDAGAPTSGPASEVTETPAATIAPTAESAFHFNSESSSGELHTNSEYGTIYMIQKGKSAILSVVTSEAAEPSGEYSAQWKIDGTAKETTDSQWRMIVDTQKTGVFEYECTILKNGSEASKISVKAVVYKSKKASVELGKTLNIKKTIFGNAKALTNDTLKDIETADAKGSFKITGSSLKAVKLISKNKAKNKANQCNYKGQCTVTASVFGVSFEMTVNMTLPTPKMTLKSSNGNRTISGTPKSYGADSIELEYFRISTKKWFSYAPMAKKFSEEGKKGKYTNSEPMPVKLFRIRGLYKVGKKTYHTDWKNINKK